MSHILALLTAMSQRTLEKLSFLEGLAPLALRLYLVPVFWAAGTNKYKHFDNTVAWFGNPEWGLGLPFPWLMAFLATSSEIVGAIFLLFGFATRLISVPLLFTMVAAALTVHWVNGWQAIADVSAPFANARVLAAPEKLEAARTILQQHGDYEWLTASGKFVILNNGIEFATTYFIMLLALFFLGGGRYVSLDYFIAQKMNFNHWYRDRRQHPVPIKSGLKPTDAHLP